jgi:hypothetical protein
MWRSRDDGGAVARWREGIWNFTEASLRVVNKKSDRSIDIFSTNQNAPF